jgi:C_GCAxxG_C_C family probable redox protein
MESWKKQDRAAEEFENGLNCAQAVLMAFREELELPETVLLKLGAGFGGGMARQQMTCGVVTGACMAIGLMMDAKEKTVPELKESARRQCLQFSSTFKQLHGSLICRDLIGYDMNTEEGRMQIDRQQLYRKVCTSCVRDSVKILEQMMDMNS